MTRAAGRVRHVLWATALASVVLVAPASRAEVSVWGLYEEPRLPSEFVCHDALHHRLVALGAEGDASECFSVWMLDLDQAPRWTRTNPGGPGPRVAPIVAAVHDPVFGRVFVYQNAKFEAPLLSVYDLNTDQWIPFATTGSAPAPTDGLTAIYDQVGNRLLMFGGASFGLASITPYNTVWSLDLSVSPAAWSVLTPSGTPPTERFDVSSILDARRRRVLVFGGTSVVGFSTLVPLDEVWELRLDPPRWKFLTPLTTPPSARGEHSAVWDSLLDRMIVYGGTQSGSVRSNQVWSLALSDTTGASWTQASFSGTLPESSSAHGAVFDPVGRRMLVHGGTNGFSDANNIGLGYQGALRSLAWETTPQWSVLCGWERSPHGQVHPAAAYDSARHQMVVAQSTTGGAFTVWTMSLGDPPHWTPIATQGATPVDGASAIVDAPGHRLLLFGGMGGLSNQTLSVPLDVPGSISPLVVSGTPPSPRAHQVAIFDPAERRMIVFGGQVAVGPPKDLYSNDLWQLALTGPPTWTQLNPGGSPPARGYAAAILDPVARRLIVWGGLDTLGNRGDLWSLQLDSLSWHPWSPGGTPPLPDYGRLAVYDPNRDRMLLTYKQSGSTNLLGITQLSLDASPAWSPLAPLGCGPVENRYAAGVYDPSGDILVLHGGIWDSGPSTSPAVWALQTGSATTPVQLSLAEAGAADGVVRLRWRAEGGMAPSATLERHEGAGPWQDLAGLHPGPSGELAFDDALVQPGHRYDYRLRILEDGRATWTGEASVTVPAMLASGDYAIAPVANPGGTLRVRLALPASYDPEARLEVLDLLGRRVASERLGPGRGRVAIVEPASARDLRPGIYLIRLRVAGTVAQAMRMVVVR